MSPLIPYLPITPGTGTLFFLRYLNARKALDVGAELDIKFRGGRGYNLRKCGETEENELAEMNNALDD